MRKRSAEPPEWSIRSAQTPETPCTSTFSGDVLAVSTRIVMSGASGYVLRSHCLNVRICSARAGFASVTQ